jgi:hypothetical protein
MLRLALNIAIKGGVLYLLGVLGLLSLHPSATTAPPWNMIWLVLGLGLAFVVVQYLMWLCYGLLTLVTIGLALLALPVMIIAGGYFVLQLMESAFPHRIVLSPNFWLVLLAGVIMVVIGIPKPSDDDSRSRIVTRR